MQTVKSVFKAIGRFLWKMKWVFILILIGAVAFAIGVFFGFYPANKAARMNPIDALYSRTQLIAVSDNANVLKLRLRVRLIGTEKR